MKRIIYIGSLYDADVIKQLIALGSKVDFPSHNFQSALLEGMSTYVEQISVITALKTSPFPRIKKLFFADKCFELRNGCKAMMVGRVNIPIINLFYKYFRVKKYLKNLLSNEEENYVIVYGPHTPFLKPVYDLHSKYRIKSCLIIPDLPEYMSSNQGKIFRYLKRIDSKLINKSLGVFDCFAPLSPWMKEKLPYGNKPWIQIEGVYDNTVSYQDVKQNDVRSILYTGKIDKRYGIKDLLDAFEMIKAPNYELWIRGNGDMEPVIKQRMLQDKRIKLIPSMAKEELVHLQKSARLLVNPLHGSEEFTRYFFPSKTLEYMGSGTPTLMCRLDCIPKEYDEFLFYFEDESISGMAKRIQEICEMPNEILNSLGARAKEFVINHKNGKIQAGKIIKLLNNI